MKIAVSAESTIDLPKNLLQKYQINTLPFTVLLGEEAGYDGEITPEIIFDYVDRTSVLPKTSAVNEFQYEEYFKSLKKDYDAIVHISLSSEISSSCQNATNVAKNMKDVYVINSKSLSTGIALLAIYARQLVDSGLAAKEVADKVSKRVPAVQASFVLNTVDYLYKGGRCSSLQRFGVNLLRIKPQIIVKKDGTMASGSKYRGKNREVVEKYCLDTLKEFNTPCKDIVFITHSSASQDMVDTARDILERKGFKEIIETKAGATISSHCGPKCLGILYFNDGSK
ncbi:MAG: DegV family EDD domain-containing protein [Bacilli bacterium]|nr:DegV family EDD domain-containing protein [Bacilli bacterium]